MDFKPTYKTGGTTSRKPSKNDRAMVSGVSSILKKIKDKKNRKEVAGSMVKQFNREGVSYNKEKFLKNSRSFQDGGTLPPIYTSNPNDPRIRSYNDSLMRYTRNPGPVEAPLSSADYEIFADYPEVFSRNRPIGRRNLWTRTFNGVTTSGADLVYKKPVQPVIYREPLKPMGIKAIPATLPFTPITSVNIPMRKEKPLPVVRHTTNYLEPDIIKHRNLDEGFYKEIREELPKPKVTPGPKEIVPKQQPRKSNPKVVYQNYKKGGTVKSKEAKLSKLYKTFKLRK